MPRLRTYAARWRGFDAAVLATLDNDGDCGFYLVATLPEARGNGLCAGLMERALLDARERGCRTSTLQASPAGRRSTAGSAIAIWVGSSFGARAAA